MKTWIISIALTVAIATLALFASLDISRAATPANVPDVECYPWADAEGWTVTRCYDYNNDEACLIASSGFVACRMGDE